MLGWKVFSDRPDHIKDFIGLWEGIAWSTKTEFSFVPKIIINRRVFVKLYKIDAANSLAVCFGLDLPVFLLTLKLFLLGDPLNTPLLHEFIVLLLIPLLHYKLIKVPSLKDSLNFNSLINASYGKFSQRFNRFKQEFLVLSSQKCLRKLKILLGYVLILNHKILGV